MKKSPVENTKPEIYQFADYRVFLKESFAYNKASKVAFSYSFCAKKMGVSVAYLKNVLAKKRNLNLDLVSAVAKVFSLSAPEERFLAILVILDQLADSSTRNYFENVLATLRARAVEFKDNQFFADKIENEKPLQDAFLHLLLALVPFEDFCVDPAWVRSKISSGIHCTDEQINQGYRDLVKQKVIALKGRRYEIINSCVSSPDPFNVETFKIYKIGLQQTLSALDNISAFKSCNFFMTNLAIDKDEEQKVKEAFNRCRDEIMAIAEKSTRATRVIAISNNMITLAKSDVF